jgi:predicted transposase YbfD/YdcC
MRDIIELFSQIEDPRVSGRCLHKLSEVLFISFCAIISNAEDCEDIVVYAKERIDWFKEYIELPNGIPSHDTFNRVLRIVRPESLQLLLGDDGSRLVDSVVGKLVSLDGKKMRGTSPKGKENNGLFVLSAWVGEDRACMGQVKVEDKSNEITAIPLLIKSLELAGSTVSIDAIGCQVEIAGLILESKADYLLSVKENQGELFEELSDGFTWLNSETRDETRDFGHGRYETRSCQTAKAQDFLSPKMLERWPGIKTLVRIEAKRTENGVTTVQQRYYISSSTQEASYYNRNVRLHWSIENNLHWHLDVTFGEDACRTRKDHAPQNLNTLRKVALQRMARMDDKLSLKKRRYKASLDQAYLQKIIGK